MPRGTCQPTVEKTLFSDESLLINTLRTERPIATHGALKLRVVIRQMGAYAAGSRSDWWGSPGNGIARFGKKMLLSASVHNGDFERHPWDKQRVGRPERNSPCHWDTAVGDSTYEKPAEGKPRISFSASEFQLTRLHPTSTRYQYALVLAYNGSDRELTICAVSRSHCWR
jgi:hypothetical protein